MRMKEDSEKGFGGERKRLVFFGRENALVTSVKICPPRFVAMVKTDPAKLVATPAPDSASVIAGPPSEVMIV